LNFSKEKKFLHFQKAFNFNYCFYFVPFNFLIVTVESLNLKANNYVQALTALARWRPFGSYVQAAASAVAARVTGPEKLDLITAVPRARMGREGFGASRQRTRFQPLRFGRRKRLIPQL
jgi:hypothetical protein